MARKTIRRQSSWWYSESNLYYCNWI